MGEESQIFIRVKPHIKPIEYLLDIQPLHMLRGGFVTKDDIRQVIEDGKAYDNDVYMRLSEVLGLIIAINIIVKVDHELRIVMDVQKQIF